MRDAVGRYGKVLVLGGGSEIARATLLALAREGPFTAVLAARDPAALETGPLVSAGVRVETVAFDARDPASHAPCVAAAAGEEDLDLVLVAFGVLGGQERAETDPAETFEIAATNYAGAIAALTAVANRLRAQGHGDVVVLSSVAGQRARRSNYVYGSAKAGLDAFVAGLRLTLAGTGIRVLLVRPGFVRTKMTAHLPPAPLSVDAETVGDAIVEALRGGRETIWVPRVLRFVMWLLRIAPSAAVRRL